MNRMLIVIFPDATAAAEGARLLRLLDAQTTISLFSMKVISKNAEGKVTVQRKDGVGPSGTGIGFAAGALIGLIGGPTGMAAGAITGSLVGAVRDYWVSGVGLDFVERALKVLEPGKFAVVAEIEEDWTVPLDDKMHVAGGTVFRRERSDVADVHFNEDIAAFKAEVGRLEAETHRTEGETRSKLEAKISSAKSSLDGSLQRSRQHVESLERETSRKIASIRRQRSTAGDEHHAVLDHRVDQVRGAHHQRSAKLKEAWHLTVEALTP